MEDSYIFASETCALDSLGAEFVRDIEPGEIVVADENGIRSIRDHCGHKSSLCIFEHVYFARPDSVIDNASVHLARQRAGKYLAREYPVEADLVAGVPDSGLDAAIGCANESGIPYGMCFIKNRYVGRTFIQDSQEQRERSVRIKLNPLRSAVEGKRVVLVDDSIVRGTTSARISSSCCVRLVQRRFTCGFRCSSPLCTPAVSAQDIDCREQRRTSFRTP